MLGVGVKSYIRLASWSLVRVVRIEANGSVQVSVDEHITSARDLQGAGGRIFLHEYAYQTAVPLLPVLHIGVDHYAAILRLFMLESAKEWCLFSNPSKLDF